jgi:hypothetical protein
MREVIGITDQIAGSNDLRQNLFTLLERDVA